MRIVVHPKCTPEGEQQFRALIIEGKRVDDFARHLSRTPSAVKNRAHALQLPLRKVKSK